MREKNIHKDSDFWQPSQYGSVRFDLHRSTSPANFYVLRTWPYLQSINKEKQMGCLIDLLV